MPRKKKITPESASAPSSSCLLICDDVLVSTVRGKHFLKGIISQVLVPKLPAVVGPYVAYVRLSNVHASQKIELSFCYAFSGDELFKFDATSPPKSDPLAAHTLILPIPPFVVLKPGRYLFEASHGGVPFATNTIEVHAPQKQKRKKP